MAPGEGTDGPRTRGERSVGHRAAAREAILAVLHDQGRDWRTAQEICALARSRVPVSPPMVRELLATLEREGQVDSRERATSDRRVHGRWWRLRDQPDARPPAGP